MSLISKVAFQKTLQEVSENSKLILINLTDQEFYPDGAKDKNTVKNLENYSRTI